MHESECSVTFVTYESFWNFFRGILSAAPCNRTPRRLSRLVSCRGWFLGFTVSFGHLPGIYSGKSRVLNLWIVSAGKQVLRKCHPIRFVIYFLQVFNSPNNIRPGATMRIVRSTSFDIADANKQRYFLLVRSNDNRVFTWHACALDFIFNTQFIVHLAYSMCWS